MQLRALVDFDVEAQAAIQVICAGPPSLKPLSGIFFWLFYYAWTYDPRERDKWVPFITYDFQVMIVLWIYEAIESSQSSIDRFNLLIEKSRDMGISWLVCAIMLWYWLFRRGDFLIGSRKEEEVDSKGNLSTPFEKIRQMFYLLPDWQRPKGFKEREHDKFMNFINPDGGKIEGESMNVDFGRGGRYLLTWFDEHQTWDHAEQAYSACSQNTRVRLSTGTANGTSAFFYRLRNQEAGLVEVKTIYWHQHPLKGAGKYRDANNHWTSAWYEKQKETMSEEDVAAEIDIKYDKAARGAVFKTYVPDLHGQPHVEAMPEGIIVRAQDPGQRHYFVLWVQFDEFGRVLVLREYWGQDANLKDVGRNMLEISSALQEAYPFYEFKTDDVGDPQGGKRTGAGVDLPDYETLERDFEIYVDYDYINDIPAGMREKSRIRAIKNCLGDYVAATKTMKLLVDTTYCPETHKALSGGYRYRTDRHGRPLAGEQIAENRPANDAIDCLGYAILRRWGVVEKQHSGTIEIDSTGYAWDMGYGRAS